MCGQRDSSERAGGGSRKPGNTSQERPIGKAECLLTIFRSRFWDAVVRDDSMDSGTEKGLGPVPLEPVHQGGGQYEPHRLNRKSSAHIFVSSEEASDRRLDTGHGD